jgi:hypothetical protein
MVESNSYIGLETCNQVLYQILQLALFSDLLETGNEGM